MSGGDLLPQSVLKNIGDKQYEKRKQAALEIEAHVKRLASANDEHRIRLIIDRVIADFAFSPQANHRKGALLCLAATTVGLGEPTEAHLGQIVPPVLASFTDQDSRGALLCLAAATVGLGEPTEAHLRQIVPPVLASFTDQDSRVRYYACEALYNIAKVSREPFIIFFNEVFDAMFRLCADSEPNVQNAVQFLDNLVKDILTESPHFNVDAFIPKLRDYLRVVNPNKRHFLISWITEFLIEIHASRVVDFCELSRTLVENSSSQDEFTRLTAIKWLKEFVEMASGQLLEQYPQILGAVLLNISHPSKEIQQVSHEANNALLSLQPVEQGGAGGGGMGSGENFGGVGRVRHRALTLHSSSTNNISKRNDELRVVRLAQHGGGYCAGWQLSATNETTVLTALGVLASIAASPQQFRAVAQIAGSERGS
eukprot:gene22232-29299_t